LKGYLKRNQDEI